MWKTGTKVAYMGDKYGLPDIFGIVVSTSDTGSGIYPKLHLHGGSRHKFVVLVDDKHWIWSDQKEHKPYFRGGMDYLARFWSRVFAAPDFGVASL